MNEIVVYRIYSRPLGGECPWQPVCLGQSHHVQEWTDRGEAYRAFKAFTDEEEATRLKQEKQSPDGVWVSMNRPVEFCLVRVSMPTVAEYK